MQFEKFISDRHFVFCSGRPLVEEDYLKVEIKMGQYKNYFDFQVTTVIQDVCVQKTEVTIYPNETGKKH